MNIINKILLFLFLIAFSGCFSVKYSFKGVNLSPEAKTASVQFFTITAPIVNPSLAQQVTDMLKMKIQSNTNLSVVNGIGDIDFQGSITDFSQYPVAVQGDNTAGQNRFTISMKVSCVNSKDEQNSFEASFSRFIDYESSKSFEQAQSDHTEEILELIIEDIFNKAFVTW